MLSAALNGNEKGTLLDPIPPLPLLSSPPKILSLVRSQQPLHFLSPPSSVIAIGNCLLGLVLTSSRVNFALHYFKFAEKRHKLRLGEMQAGI